MYTTPWCPYCMQAKILLGEKGAPYEDIDVSADPELRLQMTELSGRHTVPQIFIDDTLIGGCDELYALNRAGKLDPLLGITPTAQA